METIITGPGQYRLRNGDIVNIIREVRSERMRNAGWIWVADNGATHRDDGLSQHNGQPWPFDIVQRLKEIRRIKGWLAITDNYSDAPICETREEAIRLFSGEPAACIEIDVLEGQGLDGSAHHG